MKYSIVLILIVFSISVFGQSSFNIQSGSVIVSGNVNIVLKDTKLRNNSTFQAGNGTVIVSGTATDAQSEIGGSSSTTFYNMTINKTSNNASLGQNISVSNQLKFTSGKMGIGNYNLTMGNSASFFGQNKDRYIQTSGTGSLVRQVGNTWTAFPIGNSTFNPARLKNDGTVDDFSIRVRDNFLQNGTAGSPITTDVIPRTWLIEEGTVGGSDVSMRLIWRPVHAGSGFDSNASQISHFTGGSWKDQTTAASTSDNSYSSDHRYREATNITSFSPFGVKSGAALPVELLYFYGEKEGENVRLSWQTATEINNSHFEIEWSKDGINFEQIGKIAGGGTTTDVQLYDFLDDLNRVGFQNRQGLHYYRLKQVDLDGKYEYTNIIQVTFEKSNNLTISIYPNPASHYLKIENSDLIDALVQIFNVNGQLVNTLQANVSTQTIDISNLPNGTYFVKIGEQVKKIIIQK